MRVTDVLMVSQRLSVLMMFAISLPSAVAAKPWTAERYEKCLAHTGTGMLDPIEEFSTRGCRTESAVTKNDGSVTDLAIDVSISVLRDNSNVGVWVWSFVFDLEFSRMSTAISSGGSGAAALRSATMIVDGSLVERNLQNVCANSAGCSSGGSGYLRYSRCDFVERTALLIEPSQIDALLRQAQLDPDGKLPMKLFGSQGDAFEIAVPYREFLVIQDSIAKPPVALTP
jgi:hypothetical protein